MLAVQWHGLGFGLPALLQGFDRINAQRGSSAQCHRFINHGVATGKALFLCVLQRCGGSGNGLLPKRLQFGKDLFADMTAFTPTVAKLVQCAVDGLPVTRGGMLLRPGLDLFDQGHALGLVLGSFGADLFEPGFHHLVRGIARLIKLFPQAVVGCAALIRLLPLFAQLAQ